MKNGNAVQSADEAMMDGGTPRERVTFWKGENAGDWLIGRVADFTSKLFAGQTAPVPVAIFNPCAVSDGSEWRNVREAQVVLSVALQAQISARADKGAILALRFGGFEKSAHENEARIYTVVVQTREKLEQILSVASA